MCADYAHGEKQRGNEMRLPIQYARLAIQVKWELIAESERSNWDRRDSWGAMRCIHGTNLGTWDGPDYMCGPCEAGWSILEFAYDYAVTEWRRERMRREQALHLAVIDAVCDAMRDAEGLFDFETEIEPILKATRAVCKGD